MIRKRAGYAVRMILFILIAAFLWVKAEDVLVKPIDAKWYSDGLTNVYKEKDYYDVLFAGTSVAIANTNSQELYFQYGISSTTIGAAQQATCLSYYALEEALKYQNPQVVIFDVKSLFYSKDRVFDILKKDEHSYGHFTLDNIKSRKTRYEAFRALKSEFYPDLKFWDYFSDMYYNHAYWESLSEESFTGYHLKDQLDGNRLLLRVYPVERKTEVQSVPNEGKKATIYEHNLKYLVKMIELCREKGIDLVLMRGYGVMDWNWKEYNAVQEIADAYGLPYLDINVLEKEAGIDWKTDNGDNVHMNLSGSKKWTDYLGEYLTKNYDFQDRRTEERYAGFEENREQYFRMTEAIELQKSLVTAESYRQYMEVLQEMDKEGYTIFMTVSNDAAGKLDKEDRETLSELGITKDLKKKYRYSFLAVIDDGTVLTEKLSKGNVAAEGMLDNGADYELVSGGQTSKRTASLKINEEEQLKSGAGLHVVVYDKKIDTVLSSVYFSTGKETNPAPK